MSLEDLARRDAFRLLCDGIDVVVNKLPEIVEMATQEERAAVVAWLRDCDNASREPDGREDAVSATLRTVAEAIERGVHRYQGDE